MSSNQRNATLGILEYVAQPAAMLVAAPLLLRGLGAEQFGLWILVTAVSATAAGFGGGFGEATTRFVSQYRGAGDETRLRGCLTACLAINAAIGSVIVLVVVAAAPVLARHAFHLRPALVPEALAALRIGGIIILLRSVDAVLISCLRAFERYGLVAQLSAVSKIVILLCAVLLVRGGLGVVPILLSTVALCAGTVAAEAVVARSVAGGRLLCGAGLRSRLAEVAGFGGYGWLKSASGVAFAYGDRVAVASLLGAGPLALYALANQLTQPIPATIAAATNFLFPHLSARWAAGERQAVRHSYRAAVFAASVCAVLPTLPLLLRSNMIVALWLGPGHAGTLPKLVALMAVGNALLAMTVVPHYTALALGRARSVALINIAAAALSLAAGVLLMSSAGLLGAAAIKIVAGFTALLIFRVVRAEMAAVPSRKGIGIVLPDEALGND